MQRGKHSVYPDGFGTQQHKNHRSLYPYFGYKQQNFEKSLGCSF